MLQKNIEYKVEGYRNRWSVIDEYKNYALLENCTWGDETCYLVVAKSCKIENKKYKNQAGEVYMLPTIADVICETYDDIQTALEDALLD